MRLYYLRPIDKNQYRLWHRRLNRIFFDALWIGWIWFVVIFSTEGHIHTVYTHKHTHTPEYTRRTLVTSSSTNWSERNRLRWFCCCCCGYWVIFYFVDVNIRQGKYVINANLFFFLVHSVNLCKFVSGGWIGRWTLIKCHFFFFLKIE